MSTKIEIAKMSYSTPRRMFLRVLLSALFLIAVDSAGAAPIVVDQFVDGSANAGGGFHPEAFKGQTFTVGVGGRLTQIDVKLQACDACSGDVILSLHPTIGGLPDFETLLASQTVSMLDLPLPAGFVSFDITAADVLVNTSDELGFLMQRPVGSDNAAIYGNSSQGYAGGQAVAYTPELGSFASPSGWDYHFRTLVDTNPEPLGPGHSTVVGAGSGVDGTTSGGSASTGGTDVTFDNVTTEGTFTAEYVPTAVADLTSEITNNVNFGLPGDPMQLWDVTFDGVFTGLVTLTFGYDDSILSLPEDQLSIFHQLPDNSFEKLPTLAHDLAANTITVQTSSFSSFVLGAVPEPSTYSMAVVAILGLGFIGYRRRRR